MELCGGKFTDNEITMPKCAGGFFLLTLLYKALDSQCEAELPKDNHSQMKFSLTFLSSRATATWGLAPFEIFKLLFLNFKLSHSFKKEKNLWRKGLRQYYNQSRKSKR